MSQNNNLVAEVRQKAIVELIGASQEVKVADLSDYFGVSTLTVRRDLERLEKQGFLKKVHGGAVSLQSVVTATPLMQRDTKNVLQKRAIVAHALGLIKDGDYIFIESGSTCKLLAQGLKAKRDLKIATVSPEIAVILMELSYTCNLNFEILVSGGKLLADRSILVGPGAVSFLKNINMNKAFMTVTAIDTEFGISADSEEEAEVSRAVLEGFSTLKIGLIDSSKFETRSMVRIADIKAFTDIITDTGLSENTEKRYIRKGANITRASVEKSMSDN